MMEHFQTEWKTNDGLNIFAQYWKSDAVPAKATVCFVHGIGDHSSRHTHVAEAFTNAGFVFYTADQRGHGQSEGQRGHFPSPDSILQDIDLLLQNARKSFPGLPVILYGHSMGGILVLYYGLKRKPDLAGVISNSPGLHNALQKKPLLIMAARILGSLFPHMSISNGLDLNGISRDPVMLQAYKNDPLIHNRITMGLGKVMLEVTNWTIENAASFPLPLLIMHGKADIITYASGSIAFAAPLGKTCSLILWEKAFHEIHNEPEKNEVMSAMTDWANSLTGK
jgi:alpha-beta hydrolase superfamily lysophospholipase